MTWSSRCLRFPAMPGGSVLDTFNDDGACDRRRRSHAGRRATPCRARSLALLTRRGGVMKRVHEMPFGAAVQADGGGAVSRCGRRSSRRRGAGAGGRGASSRCEPVAAMPAAAWHRLAPCPRPRAGAALRYRFRFADGLRVPDPASRSNPDDVHGPAPSSTRARYDWRDDAWRGRPWHEAVVLRAARGHLHARRNVRRRGCAPARSRGARHHGDRADAAWPTFPAGATGATTACCTSRPTPPTARPTT